MPQRISKARSSESQKASSPTSEPTTELAREAGPRLPAPPLAAFSASRCSLEEMDWILAAAGFGLGASARALAVSSLCAASMAAASAGRGSMSSVSGTCSTESPTATKKASGGSRHTAWLAGLEKTKVRSGAKSASDHSVTVWSDEAERKMRPSGAVESELMRCE